ncbi:hypothetical protein L198_06399 [Cryptococcus wingfieldii CBS 7118]|uniref:Uncharacterized protein n=1 Tax=Cryptococcus wingfieldii CBS 7118 TaxID=1295528 RepID=A0A1E3IP52_9TREE|nr:hypothetical protein L198_06399 [Cryptococcus wingfieldii CBS 7118]ODN89706.1 hypothetical protein L198_06399 [Cryptococcus wingfieldii CBS 7118]
MSAFSDASVASPALPLTPSASRATSPLHIPHAQPEYDYATPTHSPLTPPPSLRLYSSALKAKMAAGMTAAMRDLRDDRSAFSGHKLDTDFAYDEDPIERHVRLYLTPRTSIHPQRPQRPSHVPAEGSSSPPYSAPPAVKAVPKQLHVTMDGAEGTPSYEIVTIDETPRVKQNGFRRPFADDSDADTDDEEPPEMLVRSPALFSPSTSASVDQFIPGLINFRTNSSTSTSSSHLLAPRPDAWRMDSGASTASDASFEAIKAEDMVSLYGGGVKREGSFEEDALSDEEEGVLGWPDRGSMVSTSTRDTVRPNKTPKLTPTSTIHPLSPNPSALHALLPSADLSTPPLLAPFLEPSSCRRPAHLSEGLTTASDDGYGARADESGSTGLGLEGVQPAWLKERTLSEKMVLDAGLRTQRQRAGVRRRVGASE